MAWVDLHVPLSLSLSLSLLPPPLPHSRDEHESGVSTEEDLGQSQNGQIRHPRGKEGIWFQFVACGFTGKR